MRTRSRLVNPQNNKFHREQSVCRHNLHERTAWHRRCQPGSCCTTKFSRDSSTVHKHFSKLSCIAEARVWWHKKLCVNTQRCSASVAVGLVRKKDECSQIQTDPWRELASECRWPETGLTVHLSAWQWLMRTNQGETVSGQVSDCEGSRGGGSLTVSRTTGGCNWIKDLNAFAVWGISSFVFCFLNKFATFSELYPFIVATQ